MTSNMARDSDDPDRAAKAHSVFVRLVLPPYTIHFKAPKYMKESTLDMLDKKVCKETLRGTAQSPTVREAIGTDPKFWSELVGLFKAAITSLERRSFSIWDPTSVDYESTSGALIASHYPGLWKDLERLNDLISISRNVLTVGDRAQDLAAEYSVEQEVFKLVNCAVRVTARGYDGDAGTGEEEKWQWIVNAYKKLLITSLQFLNNMVAQNERRKLMLWVSLFDSTSETVLAPEDIPDTTSTGLKDIPSNPTREPEPPVTKRHMLMAFGMNGEETLSLEGAVPLMKDDWKPMPKEVEEGRNTMTPNGYVLFVKRNLDFCVEEYLDTYQRDPTYAEVHLDMPRRWMELDVPAKVHYQRKYEDAQEKYLADVKVFEAKLALAAEKQRAAARAADNAQNSRSAERRIAQLEEVLSERYKSEAPSVAPLEPSVYGSDGSLNWTEQGAQPRPINHDDLKMLFTADAGTKILESGKSELMKRLEGYEPPPPPDPNLPASRNPDGIYTRPQRTDMVGNPIERTRTMSRSPPRLHPSDPRLPPSQPKPRLRSALLDSETFDEESLTSDSEEDEEESEEEADEEEEYPGSTEDGRGLLTDVPLILGPSEIEVLPMIVMSGIVPPANQLAQCKTQQERNALINMHTVRCHLLLAQDNGRNLLRELLIFVAAWDLREEELYFKFMVKIMEAILQNGLMPYAYHAFRDRSRSKDIISPAQAVIMKLLTNIFRARSEGNKAAAAADLSTPVPMVDVDTLLSLRSDTPLPPNVPQRVDLHILNFIFTEFRQHIIPQTCALIFLQGQIHMGRASPEDFPLNLWDMERMYEGVYQYLEFFAVLTEEGVWKEILGGWEIASELVTLLRELEGGIPKMGAASMMQPVPTRRVSAPVGQVQQRSSSADARVPSQPAQSAQSPAPVAVERPFDVEMPDPTLPPLPLPVPPPQPQSQIFEAETPLAYPEDAQDEPSDFEWRNLKKLTVLVLSSLIWKNRMVQDQVRDYGGLEALVGCCRHDEHNPYIREHAIMCLRFAVEGCEENANVIKKMAGVRHLQGGAVTLGAIEDVPREVLDTNGYETFMDGRGQVGLRRKETTNIHGTTGFGTSNNSFPSASAVATGAGVNKPRLPPTTKTTAEKAAELMQNALRDLPLGDKLVTDKQKAEALAKLDRAFESTERVLGGVKGLGRGKGGL
jgi:palmitoyltransferase